MYNTEAFAVGDCFYRVACDCVPDDFLDNEEDDGHWFLPHIVNLAFACELFLKSLLYKGNHAVRGHNLESLFLQLDEDIKEQIVNSKSFKGDEQFLSKIHKISNCFCDWRYYFEHRNSIEVDVVFLEELADELSAVAEEHLPK